MRLHAAVFLLFLPLAAAAEHRSCSDPNFPAINQTDSIIQMRVKLIAAGYMPLVHYRPADSFPSEVINCLKSTAFNGCYVGWLTRDNQPLQIALPNKAAPFIADCPPEMRR